MIQDYLVHILIMVCIYIIFFLSLNLIVGFTGILNLGHIAFFGIGAYTSALLMINGSYFLTAFVSAGVLASLSGLVLAFLTRRLKKDYLALATVGFAFVIYSLMLNLTWLTYGPIGILGIKKSSILGLRTDDPYSYLILAAVTCLISIFVIYKVVKSPYGRALQAMRDNELAVQILGKNTFKLKAQSMMMSAFFAGIAGSLFAHYAGYIEPSSFVTAEIVPVITIIIIGGLASLKGTIIASFILVSIPEALRFINLPNLVVGPSIRILYALILLLILFYKPKGFYGEVSIE